MVGFYYIYVGYYTSGWLLLHLWLELLFMVAYYIYGWLLLHLWLVLLFMVDYCIYGWYSKPAGSWWLNWFAMYPERCIWNIYNEYLAIIEWGGIGFEGFCRLGRMLSAEVDNIVQDLPKAELNNCFISHSNYFWFVINKLTFSKTCLKTLAYFSAWFRDITYVFLADTP